MRRFHNFAVKTKTLHSMADKSRPQALDLWRKIQLQQAPFVRRYGAPHILFEETDSAELLTNKVLQAMLTHFEGCLSEELRAERYDKRQRFLAELAKFGGSNKAVKR